MRAGIVAELRDVPSYESILRNAALDCLQDRVLWLLEPDVIVGYQAASRSDRFDGRRAVSLIGLGEEWK